MTETIFEIPLTPAPQTFTITLGSTDYNFTLQFRDPAPGWVLDIADANGNPLVQGIPLVTGVDLLQPFAHLNFPGQLRVQSDGPDPDAVPTFDNLGVNAHLYFVVQS